MMTFNVLRVKLAVEVIGMDVCELYGNVPEKYINEVQHRLVCPREHIECYSKECCAYECCGAESCCPEVKEACGGEKEGHHHEHAHQDGTKEHGEGHHKDHDTKGHHHQH